MKPIERNEEQHLSEVLSTVRNNLALYEERIQKVKEETEELNDRITPRDRELNSQMSQQLSIATAMLSHVRGQLKKNQAALLKPYFGRIDYEETATGHQESLYIGKHGIEDGGDIVVVDWRAPVSKVYYENGMGIGTYEVQKDNVTETEDPFDRIRIDLCLKRTFDIEKGVLNGYYDSDIAANDELLVKYLAQHKDVVLSDIIATIQREQDTIIRETPYKNIIVQGVAGSGKTTVALHRISHILYNYPKRYTSRDFLIIGSSDMLLSYIVSGLPELDVENVLEQRMDLLFKELLEDDYQKDYKIISPNPEEAFKCRLDFGKSLDKYFSKVWHQLLRPRPVEDEKLGEILSRDALYDLLNYRKDWSLKRIEILLNETLARRIQFKCEVPKKDPEYAYYVKLRRDKLKEYAEYFHPSRELPSVLDAYRMFLRRYCEERGLDPSKTFAHLSQHRFDVYDLASMALIRRYLTQMEAPEIYGQIVIDEAQDFGEMIYYLLRRLMPGCFFTIMGDVSQNINYEMGMNDWDSMTEEIFNTPKDEFLTLQKSYRNTIEISDFAAKVLKKASSGAYAIDPVIRHGLPVDLCRLPKEEMLPRAAELIRTARKNGYRSAAVVCRTSKEAEMVEESLMAMGLDYLDDEEFQLMVLPIELVKGLEFDVVLLWEPTPQNYTNDPKSAKLLYVAITRALHELHLLSSSSFTPLIGER